MKRKDLEALLADVKELLRVERLILEGKISQEVIEILQEMAERGIPRAEYDYGIYLLWTRNEYEEAMFWLGRCLKHGNDEFVRKCECIYTKYW